jgi:hypothetical protein
MQVCVGEGSGLMEGGVEEIVEMRGHVWGEGVGGCHRATLVVDGM